MHKKLFFTMLTALVTSPIFATVWYVNAAHTTGTQTGTSWATAFASFQAGINAAGAGDSIWVATGTYQPANGVSFIMAKGVKIFGGFAGNETNFASRNWLTNVCTLLGNGTDVILNYKNGLDSTALLDGFTVQGADLPYYRYTGTVGASGMYNYYSSPAVNNVTFIHNSNLLSNLPMRQQLGGGMYNNNSSPVITNTTFNNDSAYNGGGIYNDSSSLPTLNNCIFIYNFSYNNGGGIANAHGSNAIITNTSFTQNIGSNYGAGIYNDNSSPTITYDSLGGNLAGNGGGIFNDSASTPIIKNCVFNTDSVSNTGGGICNNNSSPNISHCSFTKNTYAYGGAGIENDFNSSPNISYCTFTNDTLTGSGGGGGIGNYYFSSPTIMNCTFAGNVAEYYGGAIENNTNCSPAITNCVFARDTAGVGGAIDCQDSSNCVIKNSNFSNNVSTNLGAGGGDGGAMSCLSSYPTIINCVFNDNIAIGMLSANGAGAIYNQGSSPNIINSLFIANSSTNNGGAIYNSFTANPIITNCTFPIITNCTFARDSAASGGAVYNDQGATATINNCIFWGDTASSLLDVGYSFSSSVAVSYSFTQTSFPGTGNILGTTSPFVNINNPAGPDGIFRTPDDGLYLISNALPAGTGSVAAIPTGITTDITGQPRTANNLVNMGAYENPGTTPITLLSFTAQRQIGNTALLLWSTAQEFNNSHFDIQRSADARNWLSISTVTGAGNSNMRKNYSFTDTHPIIGNDYYRLKQVDYNGNFIYSYAVRLNFDQGVNGPIIIFPNPVKDAITIYSSQIMNNATIELLSIGGQRLMEKTNISGSSAQLNLAALSGGSYIVTIIQHGNISWFKIVKQ